MKVKDILELPSAVNGLVLAGESGLDQTVESAVIMEAPDIEAWGSKGQVILTSFFAMEDLSNKEQLELLNSMHKIGIAALIFKADRLRKDFPPQLLNKCNRYGITVIRVSGSATYASILRDIYGNIVQSQAAMLAHYYHMHQRSMELTLQRPSQMQILNFLKHHVKSDVTYYDTYHNTRFSTKESLSSFVDFSLNEMEKTAFQAYEYFIADLIYPQGKTRHALAVKIPDQHLGDRILFVHGDDWQLRPFDIMAIENVVSMFQVEDLRRESENQQKFLKFNDVMHDLLRGKVGAPSSEYIKNLDQMGMNSFPYYQVLLIRLEIQDSVGTYEFRDLVNTIIKRVQAAYLNTAYYVSNNRITFLRNCSSVTQGFDKEAIQNIMDSLHIQAMLPQFTYAAMLSRIGSQRDIIQLNQDLLNMLRLFASDKDRDSFHDYDELGTFKLFLEVADGSDISSYVDARINRLVQENKDLFDSAVLLCENGLNYSETARQLYMHPKTIQYRVGRIKDVYGIDLKNADDRLQLLVAQKILILSSVRNGIEVLPQES